MFGWILLGIILLIIIVYMIIGFYFHHVMFGKRFSKDPIVKYYDISMFEGLQSESIQFEYKNGLLKDLFILITNLYIKVLSYFLMECFQHIKPTFKKLNI